LQHLRFFLYFFFFYFFSVAAWGAGLEGLEVHAQMARIGVALYVSEEEQQQRRYARPTRTTV
jgi:alanine racemase